MFESSKNPNEINTIMLKITKTQTKSTKSCVNVCFIPRWPQKDPKRGAQALKTPKSNSLIFFGGVSTYPPGRNKPAWFANFVKLQ